MSNADRPLLLQKLDKVEHLAETSKMVRLLNAPARYISAQAHKWLIYRYTRKGMATTARTFFGRIMHIVLPAATDIYLTGGKTHPSEVRLTRFLVKKLPTGGQFLDVGSHFGYFAQLGGCLVGETGRVICIEASPATYEVLHKNTKELPQVTALNMAATDQIGEVVFHEFPVLLSEYNSLLGGQYEQEHWYKANKPKLVKVPGKDLSSLLAEEKFQPEIIKIDVEGAEDMVVRGGLEHFKQYRPTIVMEYLTNPTKNSGHEAAVKLLVGIGYTVNTLNHEGEPEPCPDVATHLIATGWESDNLVFL